MNELEMLRVKHDVVRAVVSVIHMDTSLISSCTTPAQHVSWSRHTVFRSRNEHDGGFEVGMRLIWVGIEFFLGNAQLPRENASVLVVVFMGLVMEVDLSGAHPPPSPGRAAVSSSSSDAALCTKLNQD
jgi:hypothetical protein